MELGIDYCGYQSRMITTPNLTYSCNDNHREPVLKPRCPAYFLLISPNILLSSPHHMAEAYPLSMSFDSRKFLGETPV